MEQLRYRVVDERGGRFAALRGSNVLIYWPHGLGDWVHLSFILPMLEPSNRYWITRFGDDFVSVLDGNEYARTTHSGINAISDGTPPHFGLDFKRVRGESMELSVPPPFDAAFKAAKIDTVLYTDYPETQGESKFPFHTKARKLLANLVDPQRLKTFDLAEPLRSSIDFHVEAEIQTQIDERLMRFMDPSMRLCVTVTSGHTAARKSWDSAQAQRFEELLCARDKRWRFLSLPDQFTALFADLGLPFAQVFKAVLERTDLLVGVPAGPLHMAMARTDVPVVGIWHAHHPDWYDEPSPRARHLIGTGVTTGTFLKPAFDKRPATLTKPPSLQHKIAVVDAAQIPAEAVLAAAAELV